MARLVRHDSGSGHRLTIELDPAELGPVEVTLRLDDRGSATAVFTVDRPETLHLLQRDARTLVEMLESAGFALDVGGLGFSLRDDGQGRHRMSQQPESAEPRWLQRHDAGDGGHSGHGVVASRSLLDLSV